MRLLHPRRRHGEHVVLRRHVPRLGSHHRATRASPSRWSTSATAWSPSSAPEVAPFPAGLNDCVSGLKWVHAHADELGIDADAHHRRGRERRRQPHARHRASSSTARRRPRTDPGPLRDVPLHRRELAAGPLPVVDREQRHPPRPAQQPGRDGLRHRGVRARATRSRGRRSRPRTTSRGLVPTISA